MRMEPTADTPEELAFEAARDLAVSQLWSCPFCGNELKDDEPMDVIYPRTRDKNVWGIHCQVGNGGCDASMLCSGIHDAVERWNRRPDNSNKSKLHDVE